MTETTPFEERFAEQLRAYAAPAARPPRREAVGKAVEAARSVRGDVRGELRWPRLGRPSMAFAAGAAAVVLAVVGVGILTSLPNRPGLGEPALTETPTPTGAPTPTPDPNSSPAAQPSIPGSIWPQSTQDEVIKAQERADAGDVENTWQVDPQLVNDPENWDEWAGHLSGPGTQIVERFLRDELGWDAFLLNIYPTNGLQDDGGADGVIRGLVYSRCAPGETNPLYPNEQEGAARGADRCAPTIDDLRYETVSIDLSQPARRGADGIWVVSGWRMTAPFAQADTRLVRAEAEARLEAFLQARVDGEGAEDYVNDEVPLIYATTTGARYERFEIEQTGGPGWPTGGLEFAIRLFADNGATVVEQKIAAGEGGPLWLDARLTTENGRPVPLPFAFMDGKLTVLAPHPWDFGFLTDRGHAALDYNENHEERIEFVDDPITVSLVQAQFGPACKYGQSAANAAALADAIRSRPDLAATAPVTVTIASHQGLSIDITTPPGASTSICADAAPFDGLNLPEGSRMRLYLLDAPEGSSIGILAIAIKAPEPRFDAVFAEARPIIDSIEFHKP
jgi:hypothetical protein